MTSKRLLRTAFFRAAFCTSIVSAAIVGGGSAQADEVTPVSRLSQANRLSIFHDYSLDAVGQVSGVVAGAPGGGVVSDLMGDWTSGAATGTGRSYEFNFTPIFGYDSNPEARANHHGGVFGGGDLDATYRFDFGPDDATIGHPGEIKLTYDAVGAIYSGPVFKADTFQQTFGSTFHRSLWNNMVVLNLNINDQLTIEHGDGFLDTVEVAPSTEVFLLPQSSFEIGYDFTRFEYEIRSLLVEDPDASRHTINLKYHFYPTPQKAGTPEESPDKLGDILRQTLGRATVGYDYIFNLAAGSDNQYQGDRVYIGLDGLQAPGAPDIAFDIRYGHEWDEYHNPSHEGPTVIIGKPKGKRRKDDLDVFTLRGNARLMDLPHHRGTLSSFVQFDIIADRSNIAVRHFNEDVISAGFSYQY